MQLYPQRDLAAPTATEEVDEELNIAWDDVSGQELDSKMVRAAREEEVKYIRKTNLYAKVPRTLAKAEKAKIITVRWIDINKGDDKTPNYRSRLVAREIKKDGRPDLLAATPPLEALKLILSILACDTQGSKLMVLSLIHI